MDALLSKNTKNYQPLIEQAERKQLPDYLSIPEIVELQYPKTEAERTDRAKRQVLNADRRGATEALTDACNNKLLKYSLVKKQNLFIPDCPTTYYDTYIIHKDDLKAYLLEQEGKPWIVIVASLKGLLANWWTDEEAEELSISNIMNYWFRYEPKEETRAAIIKCKDEKSRIRALLNDAVDTGKLKARIETKEKKIDVHPNQITGKFPTKREDECYRGLAYTKVSTVKTANVALSDLAQFLRLMNEAPPKDSPIMTKWLAKWWSNDEPQAENMKEVENKGERNQVHSVQADDKKASGQYGLVGNDGASGNKKATRKRTTKLNGWLRERWDEWGKPNARDLAAKLKPLQGMINSPVKKYHGWIPKPGVVVDWYEEWGATSWGCRAFENKVDDFKREDKEAEKNSCQ